MSKKLVEKVLLNPEDVVIAITSRCNARCVMCNIWKEKKPSDFPISALKHLNSKLKEVNLTGGEPFLCSNLLEILHFFKENHPKTRIIINSNGLLTKAILKKTQKMLAINHQVGIRLSLDGKKDVHDKMRGVKNAFSSVMKTFKGLKKMGLKDLGISFTLTKENISELIPVYKIAQDLGVDFALSPVQNSENYFGKTDNSLVFNQEVQESLDYIIRAELKKWSPKALGRAFFYYGVKYYLQEGRFFLKPRGSLKTAFIDSNSGVYLHLLSQKKIGNLKNRPITTMSLEKREIYPIELPGWIMCLVRSEMKRQWIKVLMWVVRAKFFGCF